jgi:hypothetical protein
MDWVSEESGDRRSGLCQCVVVWEKHQNIVARLDSRFKMPTTYPPFVASTETTPTSTDQLYDSFWDLCTLS